MKKTIFFKINGFSDKVMITNKTTSEEIIDLIRSIGKTNKKESSDYIITSPSGTHLINPDYYSFSENSQSSPYIVELQSTRIPNCHSDGESQSQNHNSCELSKTEKAMARLIFEQEKKLEKCEEMLKTALSNFETRFISLSSKVENICFLKWMQSLSPRSSKSRFGPMNYSIKAESQPPCPNPESIVPLSQSLTSVLSEYKILKFDDKKEENLSKQLKEITFNNWSYSDAELLYSVKKMFMDLELFSEFNISVKKFDRWIFEVYCNYNIVPFHNFKHAFMVTQMMYSIIWEGNLKSKLSSLDVLVLLTASVSHDLNHPGFNNAYQINSGSELAIRYNDQSPLENHHLSTALYILNRPDCSIFSHLTTEQQRYIRSGMIKCILATDMSRHNEILNSFKTILTNFDWLTQSHRDLLMMILIKASDISNEARPLDVASKWIDCLFEEFFNQSAFEKQSGLPVAPFMDKEKVTKAASQCGFIRFVIYPLFESLAQLIPEYKEHLLIPVLRQLDYYSQLDIITNGKPKSRKSIIENLSKNQYRRASHQCSSQNFVINSNILESSLITKPNQPTESIRKLSS